MLYYSQSPLSFRGLGAKSYSARGGISALRVYFNQSPVVIMLEWLAIARSGRKMAVMAIGDSAFVHREVPRERYLLLRALVLSFLSIVERHETRREF